MAKSDTLFMTKTAEKPVSAKEAFHFFVSGERPHDDPSYYSNFGANVFRS